MKKFFNSILVAGAVMLVAGCGNSENQKKVVVVEDTVPTVKAVQVTSRDVDRIGTYTSTVLPYAKNNIASQSPNRIAKVNVEVGDFVKKGQILAEMDKVQLMQSELQMKNNETEYNRIKGLHEVGAVAKSDLDAIELAYKVSKQSYENLLENSILRSPINGVVTARNYDEGDMFSLQAPIFTVEQISPVKLMVAVSEVEYSMVSKGDEVEITAAALPGQTFKGRVARIHPTIDHVTHTVTVEIHVPNADFKLRPGMYCKVVVTFGSENHVVIPDIAVIKQSGSGERFVYILNEDQTVSYQKVTLGRRLGAEYEILSGVPDGAKVVTEGQIRLKDGVNVEVVE